MDIDLSKARAERSGMRKVAATQRGINARQAWTYARYMALVWAWSESARRERVSTKRRYAGTAADVLKARDERIGHQSAFAPVCMYAGNPFPGEYRHADDPEGAFFCWIEMERVLDMLGKAFGSPQLPSTEHREFAVRHWIRRKPWRDVNRGNELMGHILKGLVVAAMGAESLPSMEDARMALAANDRDRTALRVSRWREQRASRQNRGADKVAA